MSFLRRSLVASAAASATVFLTVGTASAVGFDPSGPAAVDDYFTTQAGVQYEIDAPGILANDFDPDNGWPLYVSSLTPLTSGGTASYDTNGYFRFVPDPGFVGEVTFRYTATDNVDEWSEAFVHVTVEKPYKAPVANDDQYDAVAGQTLRVPASGVLGNDSSSDGGPLAALSEVCADRSVFDVQADGSLTYTPAADFTGVFTCPYVAIDGTGASSRAIISIKVSKPDERQPVPPKGPKAPTRKDNPKVTG